MPLQSMTGFGRGRASAHGVRVDVELSSVNRRQLEIRIGLPRVLAMFEPEVQKIVASRIARGMVTGTVHVSGFDQHRKKIVIDEQKARSALRQLRSLSKRLRVPDDIGISTLLQLPDVISREEDLGETDKLWTTTKRALRDAVTNLGAMRREEGETLGRDLVKRIAGLEKLLAYMHMRAPKVPQRYERLLKRRLHELGSGVDVKGHELRREMVLLADRSNIQEELVRLSSHLRQMRGVTAQKVPVGRKLDFLCQEMLREVNTIGSKANDAKISEKTIKFKVEIENIREQAQNIE